MQKVVDLLGPPPATVIAWEQLQLKQQQMQSPHPQPSSPASTNTLAGVSPGDGEQQLLSRQPHHSSISTRGGAGSAGSGSSINGSREQHVRVSERDSLSRARSRRMASGGGDGAPEADGATSELPDKQNSLKVRRK